MCGRAEHDPSMIEGEDTHAWCIACKNKILFWDQVKSVDVINTVTGESIGGDGPLHADCVNKYIEAFNNR